MFSLYTSKLVCLPRGQTDFWLTEFYFEKNLNLLNFFSTARMQITQSEKEKNVASYRDSQLFFFGFSSSDKFKITRFLSTNIYFINFRKVSCRKKVLDILLPVVQKRLKCEGVQQQVATWTQAFNDKPPLKPPRELLFFFFWASAYGYTLFTYLETLLSKKFAAVRCLYHPQPHLASLITSPQSNVAPGPASD